MFYPFMARLGDRGKVRVRAQALTYMRVFLFQLRVCVRYQTWRYSQTKSCSTAGGITDWCLSTQDTRSATIKNGSPRLHRKRRITRLQRNTSKDAAGVLSSVDHPFIILSFSECAKVAFNQHEKGLQPWVKGVDQPAGGSGNRPLIRQGALLQPYYFECPAVERSLMTSQKVHYGLP